MREGLNQSEVNLVVRLVAGGEPLEAIQAAHPDVAPEWFEKNWASLELRALRCATPARLLTDEEVEQAQAEGRRVDALFSRGRALPSAEAITGFRSRRAFGSGS